jgi:hypothetical protein
LRTHCARLALLAAIVFPVTLRAQDGAAKEPPPSAPAAAAPQPAAAASQPAAADLPDAPEKESRLQQLREKHPRVNSLMGGNEPSTVVNDASAAEPLTVGGKWRLYYRREFDPFHFISTGVAAGISQAEDQYRDYGQGMEGYGRRYGAKFADSTIGSFFGDFLLPSVTHDDPRYFRMGSGSFTHRAFYAASRELITRHDDGTPRFAYAHLLGNFIGAAFGNAYYPDNERGLGDTLQRGGQVTLGSAANNVFHEFWPDIRAKLSRKHKSAGTQPQTSPSAEPSGEKNGR